jgi:nitrite reductase (NO-forming)
VTTRPFSIVRPWRWVAAVIPAALAIGCVPYAATQPGPRAPQTQPAKVVATPQVRPIPAGLTRIPQAQVAPPVNWTTPRTHRVELETREVDALLADGVAYRFWTFNDTVPGPMLRVRQGDTVELTLKNALGTQAVHSINLHAAHAPGGGSQATQIAPGGQATIRFQASRPGVFVYHCMTPTIGQHVANGMYGMILVEPPQGLPPVDREYYLMQGDFYLQGERGQPGLHEFSLEKLLAEQPDYVVFNGSVGSLTGEQALKAKVGETVRLFFGVGGPNLTSALHVVGGIFDKVYPEGATELQTNVQRATGRPAARSSPYGILQKSFARGADTLALLILTALTSR